MSSIRYDFIQTYSKILQKCYILHQTIQKINKPKVKNVMQVFNTVYNNIKLEISSKFQNMHVNILE